MKNNPLVYLSIRILLTSACRRASTQEQPARERRDASRSQRQKLQYQGLQNQLAQIASAANGKVGVAAVLNETGELVSLILTITFRCRAFTNFRIGMAVIKEVDAGKIKLDDDNKDDQ